MKTLPNLILRWVVLFGIALLILAIDQLAKAWVTGTLTFGQTFAPIPALADFFAITPSMNRGAAFSLLPQAGDIFLLIGLAMMVGIPIVYARLPAGHWLERIALGVLLGGVAGNAADRIRLGYVVDFVHLQLKPVISNISNLADHAIVISILILFITQWQSGKHEANPTESLQSS